MIRVAAFAAFAGTIAPGTTITAFAARSTITVTAAITARAPIASGTAITAAAGATITTIATGAIAARFARRAGIFDLGTGFLIHQPHRQANLAARIDLENLDLDRHAF